MKEGLNSLYKKNKDLKWDEQKALNILNKNNKDYYKTDVYSMLSISLRPTKKEIKNILTKLDKMGLIKTNRKKIFITDKI